MAIRDLVFRHKPKDKIVILANRKSRGYHDGYRRHLLKLFARRRGAEIIFLPHDEDMFKGIEEEIKGVKHIIIAGGDGSFEGALNYKPFHSKALGFFPLGAGNAYYSYFYKGNRLEYLRSRFKFEEMELDILEMEWDKGKLQTGFVSLGLDADVLRMSSPRSIHGFRDYFVGGVKVAAIVNPRHIFNCKVDGKKYKFDNCVTFTLAKIPYFGFGLKCLFGKTNPNNGLVYGLAMVPHRYSSFFNKALRLASLVLLNFGFNIASLPLRGKVFEVKSKKPFALQAGGEYLGFTKTVKVRVVRKQKVLVI
jgi:diacylglycerol kinase family enzyme